MNDRISTMVGREVVVDTVSSWVYMGILERIDEDVLVLKEVDAHDNHDTPTTKEIYILNSRKTGIKANRTRVVVSLDFVTSISLLEDVKAF